MGELSVMKERAEVLIEALPYIQKFKGAKFVIKCGGRPMMDEAVRRSFAQDIVLLQNVGMYPTIVHGGGPEISATMRRMNIEPKFVRGLRVTDKETMGIVKMVLLGKISSELREAIIYQGGKALGLSGNDGNLVTAKKKSPEIMIDENNNEKKIDFGLVGEIEAVDPTIINDLIKNMYIPIISPVALDPDGNSLNINADTLASKIAIALNAEKLLILTDVIGVLRDIDDEQTLISVLKAEEAKRLIEEGRITGGMIPKIEACINAVEKGVKRTHIIDGRKLHSILLEIFTDKGIGTMVLNENEYEKYKIEISKENKGG